MRRVCLAILTAGIERGLALIHGIGRILLALLLIVAAARPAWARAAREGSVVYVVNGAVYLDRGTKDGLSRGTVIGITRSHTPVAELRIVDVADHTAIAVILEASSLPRIHDTFTLPAVPAARAPVPVTAPTSRNSVVIAERDLAAAWVSSLAANPPAPLPYDKARRPAASSGGYAATVFDARTASGVPAAQRLEQLTYLRFRADNLGVAGLSLRTRGTLDLRYDQEPDRYMPGRQAIPQVYELGLHYDTPGPGLSASLGRFLPLARFAGKIDGGEVAASGETVTFTGYGGFKPAMSNMAPQNNPAAGIAVIVEPPNARLPWSLTTGYMREYAHTKLSRQAVAVDTQASYKGRIFLAERAMIDLPQPGAKDGASLSELNVHGTSPLSDRTIVSTGVRYDRGRVYPLEAAQYPQDWLPYFQNRSQTRIDADVRFDLARFGFVRPYVFWQRDISPLEPFSRISALGLGYRLDSVLGSRVAMDVDGNFGYGTRQQADFQLALSSTGEHFFGWTVGQSNHWAFSPATGIHTFLNLIRLGTFFRLTDGLRLTVEGQSALASALTSTPAPLSTWYRGDAGVSYVW